LPGQVKNNCDIRICGRADNVLSMIILDNTDAADRISKDKRGRFLMQDGTEFQGYWINL
jgi:S-DNA-T family DNA segregation ATPase FtsK/SpoIIIE